MSTNPRPAAKFLTSLAVAAAFLGLFLLSHCVSHPGHHDDHGRPCQICHVWSLPFLASTGVQLASPHAAGLWAPAVREAAVPNHGIWLASPTRPPPASFLSCC